MEEKKSLPKKRIVQNIAKVFAIIVAIVLLAACLAVANLSNAVTGVKRIDENGTLYYAEYVGDYYHDPVVRSVPAIIRGIGCSAFATSDASGDVLMCRNYDLPHRDAEGNPTGLNVVLRCNPEGKYSSINIADAAWISLVGLPYYAGALDAGSITQIPLALLPYLCMDGMNEKGLCASILALDVKEGETAACQSVEGREEVIITELLRLSLDECATVDEAIALAQSVNMKGLLGYDYHLFLTDSSGASAVLEWRYNELYVTRTDAATNFYVAFDDAQDYYYHGTLKESWELPEKNAGGYRYGYGHGYGRFKAIAQALDSHRVGDASVEAAVSGDAADAVSDEIRPAWNALSTCMSDDEQIGMLRDVGQSFDAQDSTSFTQYSAIYNSTEKTLAVWVMPDFDTRYTFAL